MGVKCTPRPNSQRVLPRVEYDRRYRQDFLCIDIMSPTTSLPPKCSHKKSQMHPRTNSTTHAATWRTHTRRHTLEVM